MTPVLSAPDRWGRPDCSPKLGDDRIRPVCPDLTRFTTTCYTPEGVGESMQRTPGRECLCIDSPPDRIDRISRVSAASR